MCGRQQIVDCKANEDDNFMPVCILHEYAARNMPMMSADRPFKERAVV